MEVTLVTSITVKRRDKRNTFKHSRRKRHHIKNARKNWLVNGQVVEICVFLIRFEFTKAIKVEPDHNFHENVKKYTKSYDHEDSCDIAQLLQIQLYLNIDKHPKNTRVENAFLKFILENVDTVIKEHLHKLFDHIFEI